MSKRKVPEPADGGKAAGKRKLSEQDSEADGQPQIGDFIEDINGGEVDAADLIDAASDYADILGGAAEEDNDEDVGPEEDGDGGAPADLGEVGELPPGLTESQLLEGEEVDLSAYSLTLPQARRVAQCLAKNDSLTVVKTEKRSLELECLKEDDELEWDSEEYDDVDAIIIAEMLRANTTVARVDLARNGIGDAGAQALAQMLAENSTIEYFNLESNAFGERGGLALCEALQKNTRLQYLNIMYNSMPTSVHESMRAAWTACENRNVGLHL
jgi:hypothetical protein